MLKQVDPQAVPISYSGDLRSGWDRRYFLRGTALAALCAVTAGGEMACAAPDSHRSGSLAKVVMGAPFLNGKSMRELFEHPDQWKQTRSLIQQLLMTDLQSRRFTDAELHHWFAQMRQWGISLGLEVGAVKPWGITSQTTLRTDLPLWKRMVRLGAPLQSIAMDEPLCCTRLVLHKSFAYAVEQVAQFIAVVRKNYPHIQVGDIEPYPSIPLKEHFLWIDALEKRLAQLHVRGLDFYRLDVDWTVFMIRHQGSWQEVKVLENYCHRRKLPFSLIYWCADYPWLQRLKLAGDSTWYTGMMSQGYNYAAIGGRPDQYVIESWVSAPQKCLPDTDAFTFTGSVKDFVRKFVRNKPRRTR